MDIIRDIKIKILSTPFTSFILPSLEISSLVGYLKQEGFDVEACYPAYLYAYFIDWDNYQYIRDSEYGQKIFSSLLFEYELNLIDEADDINLILKLRAKTEEFVLEYVSSLSIDKESIIIFHMYNKQLLSTLYFAKKVKEIIGCKIFLTGFHCCKCQY